MSGLVRNGWMGTVRTWCMLVQGLRNAESSLFIVGMTVCYAVLYSVLESGQRRSRTRRLPVRSSRPARRDLVTRIEYGDAPQPALTLNFKPLSAESTIAFMIMPS